MFKQRIHPAAGALFVLLAVAGVVLLSGCSPDRSPLGSGPVPETMAQDDGGAISLSSTPSLLVFSPRALRLAKKAKPDLEDGAFVLHDTGRITSKKGGKLEVRFPHYDIDDLPGADGLRKARGNRDDDDDDDDGSFVYVNKAMFTVKRGTTIYEEQGSEIVTFDEQEITMTVYSGCTLDDVRVAFDQPGIHFDPHASLEIILHGDAKPGVVTAYHISGNGAVEKIETRIVKYRGGGWKLTLNIPGFSKYSWADYYTTPEAEDDECLVP